MNSYKISWIAEGIQWNGDNTKEIADLLKIGTIRVLNCIEYLEIRGAESLGIPSGKILNKGDYLLRNTDNKVKGWMVIPRYGLQSVSPIKERKFYPCKPNISYL